MSTEKQTDEINRFREKRCPFCLQTYTYFCKRCFSFLYHYYLSQKLINNNLMQHSLLCVETKQLMPTETNLDADLYHAIVQQHFILLLSPGEGGLNEIQVGSTPPLKKTSSLHSVKSKKSSGFLASLVRRTKRKRKNSLHATEPNLDLIPSDSSILPPEEGTEIELNCQNYEKSSDNLEGKIHLVYSSKDSEHSIPSSKRKGNFIQKLLKRHSKEEIKKNSDHSLSIQTDFPDNDTCNDSDYDKHSSGRRKSPVIDVPSSYINFSRPHLNPSLVSALQMVQDITNNLRESENHLIETIMKHIKDPSFQRELLNSFTHHSKLQWEAERRASALANDMWLQQIEIGKAQERTLQETLNSLVKQNRQMQIDNESIYRKYEKLLKKFMNPAEFGSRSRSDDFESHMDRVLKNNEKLQYKLEIYVRQNESLEGELHLLQSQNSSLEKQLRNCSTQMQSLKGLIPRMRTDYELEQLSLNSKLQIKDQLIKDAIEAGDVLIEDLDSLKRQLKGVPFTINMSKFKCRGGCLTDLLHMSRSCISELSKELMSLYTQLMLKEKDLENIRETNSKLQESLQKSATELQSISKKWEQTESNHNKQLLAIEGKCRSYETEVGNYQVRLEEMKATFEKERHELLKNVEEQEKISSESSKQFISKISAENFALKSQVDSLNKLLAEAGAGDMERKVQSSHEQAAFYHSRYLEIFDENQRLMLEVDTMTHEIRRLKERHEHEDSDIKNHLRVLEQVQNENSVLKQKLENEHHTVQTLQTERMKYLDEKNIFKSIYQHMKAEVARYHKLEEIVSLMSKEAGHFALVAEYNKKVGDKLKAEVEEKNSKIVELRTSVEKLNELQIQNTKEKLSLCFELSEVCNLKKQADSILSLEIQKNKELDNKKKELVDSTSSTIQKIEEKQKNERSAIKILLKDVKSLFDEKNDLLTQNEKMLKENEDLKKSLQKTVADCDSLRSELNKLSSELQAKNVQIAGNENLIQQIREKIKTEMDKYSGKTLHLESTINQLEGEKYGLQESVKYLQNTTQKLQRDLDEIREKEQEARTALNEALEDRKQLEKKTIEENLKLSHDKATLTKEIQYLNQVCDQVLCDFEVNMKTTEEKESMFRKELEESKNIMTESTAEMEKLVSHISKKEGIIEKLTIESDKLTNNLKKMEREHKRLERKHRNVLNEYQHQNGILENTNLKLEQLQHEYEAATNYIRSLEQEKIIVGTQMEDDRILYKKHVEELARKCGEYEEEITTLKSQLNEQYKKLENEKSAYGTLSCLHKEISSKFMKVVKDMVEVKNAKQDALSKVAKFNEEVTKIKAEKKSLEEGATKFQDEAKHYENLYKQCLEKRMALEREISSKHLQAPSERDMRDNNCQKHKEIVESLEKDLRDSYDTIDELKLAIHEYKRQITNLEFKQSEMNLKLHESQRRLTTERSLGEQLRNTHKLILAAVLEMKERGRVDANDGGMLLSMVQSSANTADTNESVGDKSQAESNPT